MIIDPPSSFDTLEAWQAFLDEMKRAPQGDPDVQRHIELAKEEIRKRSSRET